MTQGPEKVALPKWQFTKTANKILRRNKLAGRSKERVYRSINPRNVSFCHKLSNKLPNKKCPFGGHFMFHSVEIKAM